jgi:hypothetical protein
VPIRFLLAVTEEIAVVLGDIIGHREGFAFSTTAFWRHKPEGLAEEFMHGVPPRVAVVFSDGRRSTRKRSTSEVSPERPLLASQSAGGGGWSLGAGYWIRAVPSPGELTFAWEWEERRMPLSAYVLDAGRVIDACSASERLFTDLGQESL